MKFSVVLTLITTLNVSASLFSQSVSMDLLVENQSLRDVLKLIENKSTYRFFFSDDFGALDQKINIQVKDASLESILSQITKQTTASYKILENHVVVISPFSLQQQKLTGIVTDATSGEPLPGVNILIKGTSFGVTSDISGRFEIEVPGNDAFLIFSYIGYLTEEIPVAGQSSLSVQLTMDIQTLEEVVIVGYGTMKKADLTGALSAVSGKVLEKNTVFDPLSALQGKAAGVSITPVSGQPGADFQVQIRGIQSKNASNNPIYIIDGIISESMGYLNLNDIENISILKDASSTAIYGSRAANGVVLITTKRGNKGAPLITFHTYQGVRTPSNLMPDLLNAGEFLSLLEETGSVDDIPGKVDMYYRDSNGNMIDTDWMDEVMRTGRLQYYDLSVSGGNEKSNYFISTNYQDEKGVIVGQGQEKLSFRFNSDHKIGKYLEFGNTLNVYSNKNFGLPDLDYTNYSNSPNPYLMALRKTPLTRPFEEDGSYGYTRFEGIEYRYIPPHLIAREYKRTAKHTGFSGNIFLNFKPLDGLTITPRISVERKFTNSSEFTPTVHLLGTEAINVNHLSKYTDNTLHWQTDLIVQYEKSLYEKHNFKALFVYSQEESEFENLSGSRDNTPLNSINFLGAGDPASVSNDNTFTDWAFVSYLGRLNYDYEGKYLLQATVRRDGTSRFAEKNRWGVFPSLSLGWRISQEKFFGSLTDIVNDLKIRASIGSVGNAMVGNYTSYSSLGTTTYVVNETVIPGYNFQSAVNTNLKWETTNKKDIGIDASLLKSKITLSANYYVSNTVDMLFGKTLPASAGKSSSFMVNGGEFENRGLELDLGIRGNKGDFGYEMNMNFTRQRNEVKDLNGQDLTSQGLKVGDPAFSYYGYKTNGIIKTEADLEAAPVRTGMGLGDVWQVDIGEKDGVINSNDLAIIGNRYPAFTYGMTTNLSYKRLSASIQLHGAYKFDLPYTTGNYFMGNSENNTTLVLDRWHATKNPDGNMPRLSASDQPGNFSFSDFWLSDASYLRINNITISYDIPKQVCNKILLKNAQLYLSVQNLYTFTKSDYRGVEVDVTYNSSYYGNPSQKMPLPRTWTMGLKVTL